jgi:hypothetical protein
MTDDFINGSILRRLTFRPLNPGRYRRDASMPAGYPVAVRCESDGTVTALADVDGYEDYMAVLIPGDLEVSPRPPRQPSATPELPT